VQTYLTLSLSFAEGEGTRRHAGRDDRSDAVNGDLPRASRVAGPGQWPAEDAVASLTLAYADRHLRRRRLTADDDTRLLLDLPRPRLLGDGDGLALSDGRWVAVRAAAEPVVEARAADARELARLAWHVGNRHTACQILPNALRVLDDPVLADMLAGLGAEVVRTQAPFAPEPGAYSSHHGHAHANDVDPLTDGPESAP
jgi:urease accessory protein